VSTGRKLAEIAADEGGDAEKAATGDPASVPSVPTPKARRARRAKA